MPAAFRLAVSNLPILSQTEMRGRMVSISLRIRVARFSLNPKTIKHENLRDFSLSLEPNAKIIPQCTLQLCLNIAFQFQHSSTSLNFDAISSETLTAQNPNTTKKSRIGIRFAPVNISLYASYH